MTRDLARSCRLARSCSRSERALEAWGERFRLAVERAPTFAESAWFPATIALGAVAVGALSMLGWVWRQRRVRALLEGEIARRTADLATANRDLAARGAQLTTQARRLAEINELRQRFVADLSHELRTPLSLVAGPFEDLAKGLALDAEGTRQLGLIRANVARLEVLSDELLDVARLESGRVPMRARRHDLAAFVATICERFRLVFERKGLRFEWVAAERPVVYFDGDLLDKVLTNLLANALKFTDSGGVKVNIAPDRAEFVRVSVQDTGVGIAPVEHTRLFDRFFQVERGDARRFEGVGIGLALVRDLVALHGGEVGVESALGAGSTFWFTLPLGAAHLALADIDLRPRAADDPGLVDGPIGAPADGTAAADDGSADDDPRPEVLVVEDHPDMRAYLAHHLAERFTVAEVDGGAAALAFVRARAPAAIVSDVMMPGMDGLALCRSLRADELLRTIPIVLVSAKAGDDDRVAGLALADDYLSKPVRPGELLARVSRLVRPRATQASAERDRTGLRKRATSETMVASLFTNASTPGERAGGPDVANDDADFREPSHEGREATSLAMEIAGSNIVAPELDATGERQLARIDRAIELHLADPAFGVIELAAALGLSRRQLQREIRRLTGRSPSEHLRWARMHAAERMLRAGSRDTVAEVAADVGLSPAYFSRLYSAWFGRAPSDDLGGRGPS